MFIAKTGICPTDVAGLAANNNDHVSAKYQKTPFLWSGSKDRDWLEVREYLPERLASYYEPFFGSGAIYFRVLAERGPLRAHCNDINADLMLACEVMRDDPEGLIRHLPERKNKATFHRFRELLKSGRTMAEGKRAAMFLYCNRNCLFGLGGWNAQDRYCRETVIERIRFFSPLMQNTTFSDAGCFACPVETIETDAFVFCDPPYPGSDNRACYGMHLSDDAVMALQKRYLDRVVASGKPFLWVTKWSDEFEEFASNFDGINLETRDWAFRKPRRGVQHSQELYVSRPALPRVLMQREAAVFGTLEFKRAA